MGPVFGDALSKFPRFILLRMSSVKILRPVAFPSFGNPAHSGRKEKPAPSAVPPLLKRRRHRGTQRRTQIANIANATGFARNSLLACFLLTPQAAIVLVLEDALDGNSRAGRIGLGGASGKHQTGNNCESSIAKSHLIPYSTRFAGGKKNSAVAIPDAGEA
jgi:hypothetical protein